MRLDEFIAEPRKGLSDEARASLEQARALMQSLRSGRGVAGRKARREEAIKAFYNSWQWKRLRLKVLKERGRRCEICGAGAKDGETICIDHVKPLGKFFHLRLDPKNMGVLCSSCNRGRVHDDSDYRVAVAARSNQKELAP